MRIKNLKAHDVFCVKNLEIEFQDPDTIICVIHENEDPFAQHGFLRIMESIFLNTFYGADYLCGKGEIQCYCERFEKNFLIFLKGKKEKTEILYQGERMTGQTNGVEETCFCSENVSGKLKWIISGDYREILYPSDMRDYCKYDRHFASSAMEEVVESVGLECSGFGYLTEEEWKILKEKTQKYLAEFEGVPFIKDEPLTINRKGELMFQDRYDMLSEETEKYFNQDEYLRIEFLYWLATLNLIKRLCTDIGRDGNFPIFITDFFERLDKGKDNDLLFEELRKTGRQVFILLSNRNLSVEKYCDKIVVINS